MYRHTRAQYAVGAFNLHYFTFSVSSKYLYIHIYLHMSKCINYSISTLCQTLRKLNITGNRKVLAYHCDHPCIYLPYVHHNTSARALSTTHPHGNTKHLHREIHSIWRLVLIRDILRRVEGTSPDKHRRDLPFTTLHQTDPKNRTYIEQMMSSSRPPFFIAVNLHMYEYHLVYIA